MKTLREQEEVEEVGLEETLEDEGLGEEGQEYVTILMRRVTWLDIVLIQGGHGSLIAEPMGMQLKIA
jgi:hypothetical protein